MTKFAPHAGHIPALTARRWIILAAGVVALCLQVMAQVLPPAAMESAMRVAALNADEARNFAATCLGFGQRNDGQPAKPGDHVSCPVCFTLAQIQGFAAAPLDLVATVAWTTLRPTVMPAVAPSQTLAAASFASRAPPADLG